MTSRRKVGLRRTGMLSGRSNPREAVWRKVKGLVRARSGGRCEVVLTVSDYYGHPRALFAPHTLPSGRVTFRCLRSAQDGHHVVKRSQGRKDAPENVLDVCRACHEWFDSAPQSKRGKLMAEPSADPLVAPRTWVTRLSKFERRAALGRADGTEAPRHAEDREAPPESHGARAKHGRV